MKKEINIVRFLLISAIVILLSLLLTIGGIIAYDKYRANKEIQNKLSMLNSSKVTEEEIIHACNDSDKQEIIKCLNKIHKEYVTYDGCENRSYDYTLKPMELINIGRGCCRDSAEYYSYFLDKFHILNQKVYVPPSVDAKHVFVIASIVYNHSLVDYQLDGSSIEKKVYIGI